MSLGTQLELLDNLMRQEINIDLDFYFVLLLFKVIATHTTNTLYFAVKICKKSLKESHIIW